MMNPPAPSEEMILHCDVPGCGAQLSMISAVPRKAHGWGRLSLYNGAGDPEIYGGLVTDYDLCAEHHKAVKAVLRGN